MNIAHLLRRFLLPSGDVTGLAGILKRLLQDRDLSDRPDRGRWQQEKG